MLARCLSASLHGLEANGLTLWERVIEQRRLTTRSSLQLLRVARTIAALNGQETQCQPKRSPTRVGSAERISWEITLPALNLDRCRGGPGFSFRRHVA
jgi:hypothetical protein